MGTVQGAEAPEIPRIDSVVMARPQPCETDEAVIWYDDFDGEEKKYPESSGGLDEQQAFGDQGKSRKTVASLERLGRASGMNQLRRWCEIRCCSRRAVRNAG